MKIAFATKDNETINDHFGWCRSFAIYDVNADSFNFLEMRDVSDGGDELDKIDKRIDAVKDCTILYCADIGPAAAARVVRQRIHPIKAAKPEPINEILNRLMNVLKNPPIWLKKIMERENTSPLPVGEGQGEGKCV